MVKILDKQLITQNYCKKCLGYGFYWFEDVPVLSVISANITRKKYLCEDCNGTGKNLKESNGYPTCEFELNGIT